MDLLPGTIRATQSILTQASNNLSDWAAPFLSSHDDLRRYASSSLPYVGQAYGYMSTVRSYLLPLIDQVTQKPDLATIALLLVILFISLKILNMLWQTFIFWLRLARRVVLWGGLVVLGLWMYTRGPEGVQEDVRYWFEVWSQEKEYWRERERAARLGQQQYGRAMGGGRGRGSGVGGGFW